MNPCTRHRIAVRIIRTILTVTIPAAWAIGRIRRVLTFRRFSRRLDRMVTLADLQDAMARAEHRTDTGRPDSRQPND